MRRGERGATPSSTASGIAAALAANVLWGLGNVLVAKVPLGGLGIAFHRLWIAAILYTAVLYATGGRLTLRSFRVGSMGALAFAADICAFFLAVKHTTLADATTISALQPVVILYFAGALFGERVTRRHLWCTLVAVAGIALVMRGSADTGLVTFFGELMAVLALFAWSWYFIASKSARSELPTLEYLSVVMIIGCVAVGPVAAIAGQLTGAGEGGFGLDTFLWLLAVVLVPGSGHLLVNWAHQHTTISLSSLLTLLMPVISAAAAAWWLDQPVNALQAAGIAVVLAALAIVIVGDAREGQRSEVHPPIEPPEG